MKYEMEMNVKMNATNTKKRTKTVDDDDNEGKKNEKRKKRFFVFNSISVPNGFTCLSPYDFNPSPRNNVIADVLAAEPSVFFFSSSSLLCTHRRRHRASSVLCLFSMLDFRQHETQQKKKGRWADVCWLFLEFLTESCSLRVGCNQACGCVHLHTHTHTHTLSWFYYPIFIAVWILIPPKKKTQRKRLLFDRWVSV